MARYVIDAATLLHLVTNAVTVDASHSLVAPHTIRSTALTLLLKSVGRGELTEAEAFAQHEALTGVRIRLLGDRVSRRTAWRIAREQGWDDLYVAEHLAITRLQADALVTVDALMAESAEGLVPVAGTAALEHPEPGGGSGPRLGKVDVP